MFMDKESYLSYEIKCRRCGEIQVMLGLSKDRHSDEIISKFKELKVDATTEHKCHNCCRDTLHDTVSFIQTEV